MASAPWLYAPMTETRTKIVSTCSFSGSLYDDAWGVDLSEEAEAGCVSLQKLHGFLKCKYLRRRILKYYQLLIPNMYTGVFIEWQNSHTCYILAVL